MSVCLPIYLLYQSQNIHCSLYFSLDLLRFSCWSLFLFLSSLSMTDLPVLWFSLWVWNVLSVNLITFKRFHSRTLHLIKFLYENTHQWKLLSFPTLFLPFLCLSFFSSSVDHHRHKSNAPFYILIGPRTFWSRREIGRLLSGEGGVRGGSPTRSEKERAWSRPGERPQSPHLGEIPRSLYRRRHRSLNAKALIYYFSTHLIFFTIAMTLYFSDE